MPLYLSRFSYTSEAWARLIANPEDRRKAAQSYIEKVGGKLHGFWYAFGSHDGFEETMDALGKAKHVQYRAPGAYRLTCVRSTFSLRAQPLPELTGRERH